MSEIPTILTDVSEFPLTLIHISWSMRSCEPQIIIFNSQQSQSLSHSSLRSLYHPSKSWNSISLICLLRAYSSSVHSSGSCLLDAHIPVQFIRVIPVPFFGFLQRFPEMTFWFPALRKCAVQSMNLCSMNLSPIPSSASPVGSYITVTILAIIYTESRYLVQGDLFDCQLKMSDWVWFASMLRFHVSSCAVINSFARERLSSFSITCWLRFFAPWFHTSLLRLVIQLTFEPSIVAVEDRIPWYHLLASRVVFLVEKCDSRFLFNLSFGAFFLCIYLDWQTVQ
jgi:hypothetical protein